MTRKEELVPLGELRHLFKPGRRLPFRVLDATGRLLLAQGQILVDEAQAEALLNRGAWIERDAAQAARKAMVDDGASNSTRPTISSARRTLNLFDLWEQQLWSLDRALHRLARGDAGHAELEAMVIAVAALVDRDPDVALFKLVRQDDRRFALYAVSHALHAASVALLVGRALGWEAPRTVSVVGAALTMNASIVDLQATMAEQDEAPQAQQIKAIRGHPERSVALLKAAGVDDALWLQTVIQHHEQDGGSGYPARIEQPSDEARLLRAIDVYTAKISPRALRAPLTPQLAARQLYQEHPGSALVATLIRTLGVHPPGDLVLLKSGEIGVVTRRAAAGRGAIVATLTDNQGRPHVATHQRNTAEASFAITQEAPRGAFSRVLPERVYGVIAA